MLDKQLAAAVCLPSTFVTLKRGSILRRLLFVERKTRLIVALLMRK